MIASRPANTYETIEIENLIKNKKSDVEFFGDLPIEKRKVYQIRKMMLGLAAVVTAGVSSIAGIIPDKAASQHFIDSNTGSGSVSYHVELPEKKSFINKWSLEQHIRHEALTDPLKSISLSSDDHSKWAVQLNQQGHSFLALTVQIEAIAERPYWDNCGINVGVGYCISARVTEYGKDRVIEDLLKSGINIETVDTLLNGRREQQKNLEITPQESLRLLFITQGDYKKIAESALGEDFFAAMKPEQQQAVSWLAYNLGDGIKDYRRMITALHNNQLGSAMAHMVPHYNDSGEWRRNNRAASYIMATFSSPSGLNKILENPEAFEVAMKRGVSPVEYVNPLLAEELKGKGQLPPSPYSVGDSLTDTIRFRGEWEQQTNKSRFQQRRNALALMYGGEQEARHKAPLKLI